MAAADRASSKVHLYRLAAVASVLGFPLMLVDAVRRGHPLAPNQFLHLPRLGGALAPGLRDDERRTTRHSAWIDVSQTPIVVTLGDLQDRHFSLMAFDAWGDCVASLSSRTRSGPRQHLVIVGRHWDGRLGVRAGGEGRTSITFNVTARDAESFRRAEAELTAMLARAVARGRRGL